MYTGHYYRKHEFAQGERKHWRYYKKHEYFDE